MGVAPDLTIRQKHYGSVYAMTDYTADAHTVFLSANFLPTQKSRIFSMISFAASTATLDEVVMPDVADRLAGDLSHQNFTFTDMDEYSNLDYTLIRLSLGFEYRLAPAVLWSADGDYAHLTDDAAYVYGDESGSFFLIRSGIRFDF